MSKKQVTVDLNSFTLNNLITYHYNLYGFKAVQGVQGAGYPLIWFQVTASSFLAKTIVTWQDSYEVYISTTVPLAAGEQVSVGVSQGIAPGQTAEVGQGGAISITGGGQPGKPISIRNSTETEYTCGVSQPANTERALPFCGLPLFGKNLSLLTPVEIVLLEFSTGQAPPGTAIASFTDAAPQELFGPGLLINMTSLDQCVVSYDIDKGWGWTDPEISAQEVSTDADLISLLLP